MRKIFILAVMIIILGVINPAYSDEAPQDDSVPYNPYPEQSAQPQTQNVQTQKKTVKKVRAKKPAPKPAPKKTASKPAPKPDYLQQAINLLNQGRYEAAKPYLLKAIQTNRNDPNVWYWYGKYHEHIGSFYQAQYYFTKAIQIDPSFEPLSRVVYYPNDPLKTPLWDPKRPARVYPVETSGRSGITTVPPNAKNASFFPPVQNDPVIPKVPIYTPPEPGARPIDGDSWSPSVYVPPSPDNINSTGGRNPIYIPPNNNSIISEGSSIYDQISVTPIERTPSPAREAEEPQIVRADKPLYNPPEPGNSKSQLADQKISTTQKTTTTKTPAKKVTTPAKSKAKVPVKTVTKPTQPAKPARNTQPAAQTRRTQPAQPSQPVTRPTQPETTRTQPTQPATRPAQPEQTRTQTTPPASTQVQPARPVQPEIRPSQTENNNLPARIPEPEPEITRTPARQQQQYLPPVGQFPADPGTIEETPIPPVGQGSQY